MSTEIHPPIPDQIPVTLRSPTAMDQLELRDLARRAGEVVPEQPLLIAAVDGNVVAARSLRSGVLVFDDRDDSPAQRAALHAVAQHG